MDTFVLFKLLVDDLFLSKFSIVEEFFKTNSTWNLKNKPITTIAAISKGNPNKIKKSETQLTCLEELPIAD